MADNRCFNIITVNDRASYEGVRALWSEVFGDPLLYIDGFFKTFGNDIKGFAVTDESGDVCSALVCYPCGTFAGSTVYVSYAVCTRSDRRGLGLAGMLVSYVRDEITGGGGISIVSPAEPSLIAFYEALGYEPFFCASDRSVMSPDLDDDEFEECDEFDLDFGGSETSERFDPAFSMEQTDPDTYNKYRETFLADIPHIELNDAMLALIASESEEGFGFYIINRGDAVCTVTAADAGKVRISELIMNPVLEALSSGIDEQIASMIAKHFGSVEAVFRTPGEGRCQSMAAGLNDPEEKVQGSECMQAPPYFGFPMD